MVVLTMYSDGAMNSIVDDLISGRRLGSPYVLLTGSYWNSSGTEQTGDGRRQTSTKTEEGCQPYISIERYTSLLLFVALGFPQLRPFIALGRSNR